MIDTDNTDDSALFADAQAQAESLLHGLMPAAGGIGLYVKANKTEMFWIKRSHHNGKGTSSHPSVATFRQHMPGESVECYKQVIDHIETRSIR